MNIARKINSTALSVYQMLYNIVFIAVCLVLTVLWLKTLLQNTTPWDGLNDNDGWGLLIYGFLLGFGMIFVFADMVGEILTSFGIVFGVIKIFTSKTRKTGFIFAIINTICIFLSSIIIISMMLTVSIMITTDVFESYKWIPITIISGELVALLWNLIGFVLHLVTDISYFVSEKRKNNGIIG